MDDRNTLEPKISKETFSVYQFIDRNFRYLQYVAYGVGCVGIVLIARSIRLTKKFESINDVPNEFFEKRVKLYGKVNVIKMDEKNLLMLGLDHTPIVTLKRKSQAEIKADKDASSEIASTENNRSLQIAVPGVAIKQQFLPQIRDAFLYQNVKITLLSKQSTSDQAYAYVECKLTKVLPFYTDLSKWCMQNGIGTISKLNEFKSQLGNPHSLSSKDERYYKDLEAKLNKAKRKGLGLWKDTRKRSTVKWAFDEWLQSIRQLFSKFRNK